MADQNGFSKLAPGFEFLQSLAKNAGTAMPTIGHWVAPTLNPEEIEKRIEELRTVKFWLEQNGRMLDTTIQALEVQRMTLSTLKTMNVHLGDLRDSMLIRKPTAAPEQTPAAPASPSAADVASSAMAAATSAATAFANAFQFPKMAPASPPAAPDADARTTPEPATNSRAQPEAVAPPEAESEPDSTPAPVRSSAGVVDPMQWWGALTKQFTALASSALQDPATAPGRPLSAETAPAPVKPKAPRREAVRTIEPERASRRAAAEPHAEAERSKSHALPRKKAVRKSPGR